jgi:hypothetical protein
MHFRGLDWATVQPFALIAFLLLLVALLSRDISRARRRPALERDGWSILRPCIALYALDVVALVLVALFSVSFVVALVVVLSEPSDPKLWIMLVLAPPMTMLGLYQLWYTLFVRIRFNNTGIDWRGVFRRRYIPWAQVARVRQHSGLGPRAICADGRRIGVWAYLNGFDNFIAMARSEGVVVDDSV